MGQIKYSGYSKARVQKPYYYTIFKGYTPKPQIYLLPRHFRLSTYGLSKTSIYLGHGPYIVGAIIVSLIIFWLWFWRYYYRDLSDTNDDTDLHLRDMEMDNDSCESMFISLV